MLHRRYTSIAEEPEVDDEVGTTDSPADTPTMSRAQGTLELEKETSSASFPGARRTTSNTANAPRSSTFVSEDSFESDTTSFTDEDDVFVEDEPTSLRGHPITRRRHHARSVPPTIPQEIVADGDLTAGQVREIKEAFTVFDNNGDGCISATELKKLVTSLGYNITEAELMDMMNQIDSDGNGAIDFPEFLGLMTRNLKDVDKDDIITESFRVFDRDNSGTIGAEELHRVMKLLGQDFRDFEIEAMIKAADIDGDGAVNFDDFKKMMNE